MTRHAAPPAIRDVTWRAARRGAARRGITAVLRFVCIRVTSPSRSRPPFRTDARGGSRDTHIHAYTRTHMQRVVIARAITRNKMRKMRGVTSNDDKSPGEKSFPFRCLRICVRAHASLPVREADSRAFLNSLPSWSRI